MENKTQLGVPFYPGYSASDGIDVKPFLGSGKICGFTYNASGAIRETGGCAVTETRQSM